MHSLQSAKSVTSSTFEEVGEELIGSASGLDLTSRARPGNSEVRGGAAVSRGLSPDGVAAASGPARSCEGCSLGGGAAVRGASAQMARLLPVSQGDHAVEKAALSVERAAVAVSWKVLMALAQKARPVLTFPLERRSRWAEPGLKGETERRGGSSPCSSSRLGIWESPHLSLDLGESPHPVS